MTNDKETTPGEEKLLLDQKRKQLVSGLASLKRTDGALRGVHKAGELDGIALNSLNDLRLDHHGLLKGIARVDGQRAVEGTMTFALGPAVTTAPPQP